MMTHENREWTCFLVFKANNLHAFLNADAAVAYAKQTGGTAIKLDVLHVKTILYEPSRPD